MSTILSSPPRRSRSSYVRVLVLALTLGLLVETGPPAAAQTFDPTNSSAPLGILASGSNSVLYSGGIYRLQHRTPQGQLTVVYEVNVNDPDVRGGMLTGRGGLSGIIPIYQGGTVYRSPSNSTLQPKNLSDSANVTFSHSRPSNKVVRLSYQERIDGITLRKNYDFQIVGKTLVIRAYAVSPRSGPRRNYMGVTTNFAKNVTSPVPVPRALPYSIARQVATVITGAPGNRFYYSTQADLLNSNANSGPQINDRGEIPWGGGGFMHGVQTRYQPMRSDSAYQPLDDTLFLTVSDDFFETLPGIHRPVSPYRRDVDRRIGLDMWTLASPESLFAAPGDKQYQILDAIMQRLESWGLEDLWFNWNQWARSRVSGTCRGAAPQMMPTSDTAWTGSDAQVRAVFQRMRQAGHLVSLYQNYNDAYVNSPLYNPADVRIGSNGYPTSAGLGWINDSCPGVYVPGAFGPAPQPLPLALEASARFSSSQSSQVKSTFPEVTGFVDVTAKLHMANLVNYNTSNSATRSYRTALNEVFNVLDTMSSIFRGPLLAEGNQGDKDVASYITPGLVEAFEGGIDGREGREVIPDLELMVVKPHAVRFGMGYHDRWIGDSTPTTIAEDFLTTYPLDKLRATTLAYGHAGFITDMPFQGNKGYFGDMVTYRRHLYDFMVKEYYTFRAIQERYLASPVRDVTYRDQGRWATLPEVIDRVAGGAADPDAAIYTFFSEPLIRVRYADGLQLFVNRHPTRVWRIRDLNVDHFLPPNGWLAEAPDGFRQASELVDSQGLPHRNGHRVDYVFADDYIMMDGRGTPTTFGTDYNGRPVASTHLTVVRPGNWWLTDRALEFPEVRRLSLAQVTPDFVDGMADTWVSLYGQGFTPGSEVYLQDARHPASRVSYRSASEIRILVPRDQPAGSLDVTVRNPANGQVSDPQVLSVAQRTDLLLEGIPTSVSVGQPLTLDTSRGDPGQPLVIFSVRLNGLPFFRLMHEANLNGLGEYRWSRTVQNSDAVDTMTFQVFALEADGSLAASNQVRLNFP